MKTNLSSWIGSPAVLLLCVSAVLAQDGSPAKPESEAVARSVREALNQRLSVFDWPLAETAKTAAEAKPQAKLTLDEVLSTVELYHPKLLGAERQRRIASAKRLEKQGAFDPVFTTGADYLRFNTDFDSKTLRGKPATMRLADAGVEVLTRSGIKIGGGTRFNLGKVKAPLSPTGSGGEYFMEFKMPLLRGWRINEKSAAERQALLGEPLADTEFQTTRLDLLLKAATTYWEWVA
ncbi:MAG TPA: TolC family protein, partial [Blastocatellia bacterium]|nr:TolC family protein [Blastocatellia bacterium]